MSETAAIGALIAQHRRRRGYSQAKLGELLNRSESWVSQVERGVLAIDRLSVLLNIARVLDLPPAELLPGARLSEVQDQEHPAVLAVRMLLSSYEVLTPTGAPSRGEATAAGDLEDTLAHLWDAVHAAEYDEMARLARQAIPRLESARQQAGEEPRRRAAYQLAEAYHALAAGMAKLRQPDLAWIAADRAIRYAEQLGLPALAAAGAFRLAHVFLSARRLELAEQVVTTATGGLASLVDERSPAELLSVWGALHLTGAVIAARRDDREAAHDRLRIAREAATWLGSDRNDFHTEFGPTNVALHEVAVAVELGDAGAALHAASGVDPSALSAERRARFLVDVARAHHQRRQYDEVLRLLLEAEALTPGQVRAHYLVRTMVRDLLSDERRPVAPELRGFAQRVGAM